MKKILQDYTITPNTMILIPARHLDYRTMVIETGAVHYVNLSPLDLIKTACLQGMSTYDGRRNAIMYLTGFKRKVPIPIIPALKIFAFPTLSPEQFDCTWIFPHHIQSIQPTKQNQSNITFQNGQELTLNESSFVLEKQVQRTAYCVLQFLNQVEKIEYV
ncbi:hypothetical protein GCM10008967_07030 [Bacillus carboniphilus]|uniref:Competence protein ComK n=1 Tax=Bacillus carboniphilus TaxID=86663 RepID=A0ABP3FKP7_9BACI